MIEIRHSWLAVARFCLSSPLASPINGVDASQGERIVRLSRIDILLLDGRLNASSTRPLMICG